MSEKTINKRYERRCVYSKCCHENKINVDTDSYILAPTKTQRFYHYDCYIEFLIKNKKESLENAEKIAREQLEETIRNYEEKIRFSKCKDDLNDFLLEKYGLQCIPVYFFTKLDGVIKGEKLATPIPIYHIYDMWKQKINYLNKVSDRNTKIGKVMTPIQRLTYDLAIIVGKYNDYLTWLQKQQTLSENEIRHDINSNLTDNAVFENIINSSNNNKVSELDDLDEWI